MRAMGASVRVYATSLNDSSWLLVAAPGLHADSCRAELGVRLLFLCLHLFHRPPWIENEEITRMSTQMNAQVQGIHVFIS